MTSSAIDLEGLEERVKLDQQEQPVDKADLNNRLQSNIAGNVAGLGTEVAAGLALDYKTAPLLVSPVPGSRFLYAGINAFGAGAANYAAQKMRGEENINYGELISSAVLGIIPFTSLRFGKQATNILGEAGTIKRAVVGGAGMGAGDRFIQSGINEGELPSPTDVAIGTALGGTFGGVFQKSLDEFGKIAARYKDLKNPSEIANAMSKDPDAQRHITYWQEQVLKARESGNTEQILESIWNYRKAQGNYEEYVDYKQFRHRTKNIRNKLEDEINGKDPFYNIDDLSEPDQKKLRKLIAKHEEKESNLQVVRKRVEQLQKDNPDKTFTIVSKDYRDLAGFIPLEDTTWLSGNVEPGLLRIAKEEGRSIKDVYEYLRREKVGNKQLRAAIDLYNKWAREPNIKQAKAELAKLESQGILTGRDASRWRRILYYAEKKVFIEKGHKESLLNLFMRSTSSGDRLSNVFLEYVADKPILTADGTVTILPGNRSRKADKDLPLYTLMKLRGASRNLRDDFRKVIMPENWPSESVPEEFEEVAEILYRNRMDKITKKLDPEDPDYELTLRAHSIAVTDGLYAMIQRAIDGGISYEKIEDQFLIGVRVLRKYTVQDLRDTFKRVFDKTLKRELGN